MILTVDRTWGVWDRAANRWRHEPSLTYHDAIRVFQRESEQLGFNLIQLKQGAIEVVERRTETLSQTSHRPTAETIVAALRAYVAEIDPQRCCSIERGPARDKFGVFAVLRMDGALTLRSWDREAGRWY